MAQFRYGTLNILSNHEELMDRGCTKISLLLGAAQLLSITLMFGMDSEPKNTRDAKQLSGHTSSIQSLIFNHQDTLLASGSGDGTIKLWDTQTGECLRTLTGHTEGIYSLLFNRNSALLVSASSDNTIKIWSLKTGKCSMTLRGHSDCVFALAFNSNELILASGSRDNTIKLWDIVDGECIQTLSGHEAFVFSVAFNHDGTRLTSGSYDGSIKIWDIKTGTCLKTLKSENDAIWQVAFNQDGTLLASMHDGGIKLWDVASGKWDAKTTHTLAFYSDNVFRTNESGSTFDLACGKKIKFLNDKIYKNNVSLGAQKNTLYSFAFDHKSPTIIGLSDWKTIEAWNIETNKSITLEHSDIYRVFDHGPGYAPTRIPIYFTSITLSHDQKKIASGRMNGSITLWNLENQEISSNES